MPAVSQLLLPAAASAEAPAHLMPDWSSCDDKDAATGPEFGLLTTLGESCCFLRLNDFRGETSAGHAAPDPALHNCTVPATCDAESVSFRSDMQSVLFRGLCMLLVMSESAALVIGNRKLLFEAND